MMIVDERFCVKSNWSMWKRMWTRKLSHESKRLYGTLAVEGSCCLCVAQATIIIHKSDGTQLIFAHLGIVEIIIPGYD